MIDWPNLLLGTALGVAVTLAFWAIDRTRSGNENKSAARAEWFLAASQLMEVVKSPTTTADDLHRAVRKYPIWQWRSVLGPRLFRKLDETEAAFDSVYLWAARLTVEDASPHTGEFLESAMSELSTATRDFTDTIEEMYTKMKLEVSKSESRADTINMLKRHPLKLAHQAWINRRLRP